jgi:hypothetical protein
VDDMSDPLGLSIGVANLRAARVGGAPMTRRAVLTLFGHRPPEVGVPEENPNLNEPGLVLRGFIERIGDPAPFVAPDGSTHRSDALVVEALDAMARAAGNGPPAVIAVPGYWGQNAVGRLRDALLPKPALAPNGRPPALVSDATTALAALYAKPGFPTDGVVALCDFGAGGTSLTLTDAAADFRHIGETVRCPEFSGDWIDHAILNHLPASAGGAEAAGTAPLAPPMRLLDECRSAKEKLSSATVAVVPGDTPGIEEDIRISRAELENLIAGPLERFVTTVQEILRRNDIPTARLAAVATVGGGACIPLVTQQLQDRLHVAVVSTPQPTLSAAIGAAVLAGQRSRAATDAPTTRDAAATAAAPTAGAPTDKLSSAWAAEAARAAAGEASADGDRSATHRALAWSQEASGNEPLPYDGAAEPDRPPAPAVAPAEPAAPAPERLPWYKRSGVLFSLAAAAALTALLGAALMAFKLSNTNTAPIQRTTTVTPSRLPSVSRLPASTTETTPPPASTSTETVIVPPPPSTTGAPRTTTSTTTTSAPTTTTPTTTVPTTTLPTTTFTYPPVTTPPTTQPYLPRWLPGAPGYGQ